MKLVIQIPCYNEEENISNVLESIPKKIKGIDDIEVIILNDGSTDNSISIAKQHKNVEIVESKKIGLAKIFNLGLNQALKKQADILVNLDGDNQYKASEIEKLIKPILNNSADIVIGTRPINKIKTFSLLKKILQRFGSYVVKVITGYEIYDAASGFRAYSKKAILSLNIFSNFTYTIESLIQAKSKNLIVENIDIEVNYQPKRKSKLFSNMFSYIFKQGVTLTRYFIIYKPFRFFGCISLFLFLVGIVLGIRFLLYYFSGYGNGHIQSLILCSIILSASFVIFIIAIIGDLLTINRKLLEDIQYRLKEKTYKK